MDPEANLREQQVLHARLKHPAQRAEEKELMNRLRELQEDLEAWYRKGGFV